MAKNSKSFRSGENNIRGRSKRTLILESILESAHFGLEDNSTPEQAEKAFFGELVKRAVDIEDNNSGLCLRLLTERGWSALKPSSDCVTFEFDANSTLTQQASQVMDAVAKGNIPPDLGLSFVSGIKSMIDIEVNTELKDRIEKLEVMLNG